MAGTPKAEVAVSEALVSALVADQHPQYAHLPVTFAAEGWDNFTFRLGEALAVRLPRRAASVELIVNEQRWLSVAARDVSLPVPAPLATGVAGRGYAWPWSIVPWIEGAPVAHAPLDEDQGVALANVLRDLHHPAPEGAPTNPVRGVRLDSRRERFEPCLDRVRGSCDLISPAIDRAWKDALAAPFTQSPVWLHGDLHAQNVLSRNGKLAGVIDWGDMCVGDPAVDLGGVWILLSQASARAQALSRYAPDDDLVVRAIGWAILFGATLYDNGRVDDREHAAVGETTLRRLAEDL